MTWLKSNWPWASFNLFATSILVLILSHAGQDWSTVTPTFDPELESGKWAVRFLLICLGMTPLNTYFGWRAALTLRKPAGLWSFGFGLVHVLFYIDQARLSWLKFPMQTFIVLGLAGLLILSALAVTSNRWAIRRLKKNWKRLHRLVYVVGPLVIYHAMLATEASKKLLIYDPQAIREMNLYLAVLAVLLVVRVPVVRRALKPIALPLRSRRRRDVPLTPLALPKRLPQYVPHGSNVPNGNGHKPVFPLDIRPVESQPEEAVEAKRVAVK